MELTLTSDAAGEVQGQHSCLLSNINFSLKTAFGIAFPEMASHSVALAVLELAM